MSAHDSKGRILFVLTSNADLGNTGKKTGYFLSEVTHPLEVLTDAGYTIDFVSPQGGPAPMDPGSRDMDDPANQKFLGSEKWQRAIDNTRQPEDVNPEDYDAIFYAGGHGTMWDLPDSQALADLTAKIYENDGIVGAVCHGPAGLVNVKLSNGDYLVKDKKVASFTDDEERGVKLDEVVPFLLESKLKERGAKHGKADPFQSHVEVDGRLVTGQNPQSAKAVGEAIRDVLNAR